MSLRIVKILQYSDMSKPPKKWYVMALKVINVPFCNFNFSVHKEASKEVLILRVSLLILAINAYIKYN